MARLYFTRAAIYPRERTLPASPPIDSGAVPPVRLLPSRPLLSHAQSLLILG